MKVASSLDWSGSQSCDQSKNLQFPRRYPCHLATAQVVPRILLIDYIVSTKFRGITKKVKPLYHHQSTFQPSVTILA
jgi:hypothetical protein